MHCDRVMIGIKEITLNENALEIGRALKRYELKKLHSYIRIIEQVGDKVKYR